MRRISGTRIVGFLCFALGLFFSATVVAQETIVTGKITDAGSGDPMPFVNVIFKGTVNGANTDFDGNFTIKTTEPADSIIASFVGYKTRSKVIQRGIKQTINIQLAEDVTNLQEVVFKAGENPAWAILRKVMDNKKANDKRKLSAYEYDTYTKIEIDVDNISQEMRDKKFMKKIQQVLDSIDRIAGDDGKPIFPIMITESVSKVYYRDNPSLKTEILQKNKINGVGMEDGTLIQQLIGSSFQEYNFYQSWLSIMGKDFVSPIAESWRLYYDYDLTDSAYIDENYCYRLDFYPKSPQELAFTGTMWIAKEGYALKQIDAVMDARANINFIEKIKIQQELARTAEGAWLPIKNRVLIDLSELTKASPGMLAKFYTSNKNIVVNKPYENSFYEKPIQIKEDARMFQDEKYWDTLRHEPLSETEVNVYKMIDTLRNIPVVKTYTDLVKIALNGYINAGKIELGPFMSAVSWNNIEGIRIQPGFKTTYAFSKKFILQGQLGYGFDDQKFKYLGTFTHILSRERWTTWSIRARRDLSRLGVDDDALADNPIFLAGQRWGYFRRGYYMNEYRVAFQRELFKGFSQKIFVKYFTFDPTYDFGYYENPTDENSAIRNSFETTEVALESRYARDEVFLQNDNDRVSLGIDKAPVITVRYTHGVKGVWGSDFEYDKLRFSVVKRVKTGPLGVGYATLTGEYIFNTLPYPLLALHLGNQSPIYSPVTYNLMNYGEFVSDHYAALQYRQYLEGFLLNRIPAIKKLHWRLLATGNFILGGMRASNRALISELSPDGNETLRAGYFKNGKPYIELGYGVENIFKFLRVDFVHRLSYLDNEKARKFGVLFTAQLQF